MPDKIDVPIKSSVSEVDAVINNVNEKKNRSYVVKVANEDLIYRSIHLEDSTPTGLQLSAAAGFRPNQNAIVLQVLSNGELEDIRPDEIVHLSADTSCFVILKSDRTYRFTIDGIRFDWPNRIVSGGFLRKLASIPADKEIFFERKNQPDQLLQALDLIDLDGSDVENFYSQEKTWALNVQGVILEFNTPTVIVRDALEQAGFDSNGSWHIFLKVTGQAKQEVNLTTVIDLRLPGIEKLRLTPREVNNGEGIHLAKKDFALLDVDETYLNHSFLRWETITEAGRRWLLMHDYLVPDGYTLRHTLLAFEIPSSYPGAQIDMFYVYPPLTLTSGREIDRTQVRATVSGVEFHGWSRHRGGSSPWNPSTDNVITHLALVESALIKELGL